MGAVDTVGYRLLVMQGRCRALVEFRSCRAARNLLLLDQPDRSHLVRERPRAADNTNLARRVDVPL